MTYRMLMEIREEQPFEGEVAFDSIAKPGGQVQVDGAIFEEMGRPDIITLTVEAGNHMEGHDVTSRVEPVQDPEGAVEFTDR